MLRGGVSGRNTKSKKFTRSLGSLAGTNSSNTSNRILVTLERSKVLCSIAQGYMLHKVAFIYSSLFPHFTSSMGDSNTIPRILDLKLDIG